MVGARGPRYGPLIGRGIRITAGRGVPQLDIIALRALHLAGVS